MKDIRKEIAKRQASVKAKAKIGLDNVDKESSSALPSFEELVEKAKRPEKHMCERCLDDYDVFNEKKRKTDPKWEDVYPICTGARDIPSMELDTYAAINGALEEDVKEDYSLLMIHENPLTWGAAMLDITTSGVVFMEDREVNNDRWYQKEMLACSSQFKVYKAGRRIGKSSHLKEILNTVDGPVSLQYLKDNPKYRPAMFTYNEKLRKIEITSDYSMLPSGNKKHFRLTTKLGRENHPAHTHPYLTMRNGKEAWIRTEDLKIGDYIAVPSSYNDFFLGEYTNVEEARLLGYLGGDGGMSSCFISFSNISKPILKDVKYLVSKYKCDLVHYESNAPCDYRIVMKKGTGKYNALIAVCNSYKMTHTKSTGKTVPSCIFKGTKDVIRNYLGALWDCDGWLSISSKVYEDHTLPKTEIGICLSSKKFIYDIHHLLLRLNIVGRIKLKKIKYKGGINFAWSLCIGTSQDQNLFIDTIPLVEKCNRAARIRNINSKKEICDKDYTRHVPSSIVSVIRQLANESEMSLNAVCRGLESKDGILNSRIRDVSVSKNKLSVYAKNLKSEYLASLAESSIIWDRVSELTDLGVTECWDLSVNHTNTIVYNDIISHNTFVMRWETIHYMMTTPNAQVLLICPYEKQVLAFLKDIDKFIEDSPYISQSVKHRSKSKHTLTLHNGAHLESVMTGGAKAGGGDKARGQPATLMVFDECDFISEKDIEAAIAILADNPACKIMASSTPTGQRKFLYEICTNKARRYKEFSFPTHVSPVFTKIADDEIRAASSVAAYRREILAEFGEELAGLFTNIDIDRALKSYYLADERHKGPQPGWIYMVGVDWNGAAIGTHIVVTGYYPPSGKYKLVDKVVVANETHTHLNGCRAVVNTFEYWNASHIYADFGAGMVQSELILRHAVDNDKKKLAANFKAIAMQSNTEVRNPASGLIEKKNTQQLAVDLLAHHMEQGWITLPYSEDVKGADESEMGLVCQMRHFSVDKISISGKPKYSGVDHTLTAFYLTILAFQIENSSMGQTKYDNTVITHASGEDGDGLTVQGVYQREKEKRAEKGVGAGLFMSRNMGTSGSITNYGSIPTEEQKEDIVYEESEASIKGQVAMRRPGGKRHTGVLHSRKSF